MSTLATCAGAGLMFDPSSGYCYRVGKDREVTYWDEIGNQLTAPYVGAPVPSNAGVPPVTGSVPAPLVSPGVFDSITSFLATPGPFGLSYGLIGLVVVGIAVFAYSSSGTTGRKSAATAGWI